ncbi:MAG: DUF2461 domain-containing protein [Chloroflexota bacterium]
MLIFPGFPEDALTFYAQIAENNNKPWFEANKPRFKNNVQKPAQMFVEIFGDRLRELVDGMQYDTRLTGSGSIFRIYRDTRFSKDKTPYKTNLAIAWWQGSGKKTNRPSFYFGLEPDSAFFGGGTYMFVSDYLEKYREAVADDKMGNELADILAEVTDKGYTIRGEQYKKVPRGYDKEHPRGDLLKYKGMYLAGQNVTPDIVTSADLVDHCYSIAADYAPLIKWQAAVFD